MNQVIRATMPVFVAFFQWLRSTRPPVDQLGVLVIISLGVVMVVYHPEAMKGQWFGICMVTTSVVMQAAQMSFAGSILSANLDSFQLTFYTSPPAFLLLAGPASLLEGQRLVDYASVRPWTVFGVFLGTCLLAVLYNVVVFQTIHRMSAVGSAVLGNVKVVILIALSSQLLGEMTNWTGKQYAGCFLTFLGAGIYSALKLRLLSPSFKQVGFRSLWESLPLRCRVFFLGKGEKLSSVK